MSQFQMPRQPNPYRTISTGGKPLPGPMPANPYAKGPSNISQALGGVAPPPPMQPLKPLNVPGVNTLADAGGPQHMGAGSIVGAGGAPKWWDGTQPSNAAPAMGPGSAQTMEQWQSRQAGRTSPGISGLPPKPPGMVAAALGGSSPPPPQNPMFTALGLQQPTGPNKSFNNYRTSAMMQKQAGIIGHEGMLGAMGMGGQMMQHAADNQLKQGMFNQQMAGRVPENVKAQLELHTALMGEPGISPDQKIGLAQHASTMLGGSAHHLESLKSGVVTPFPKLDPTNPKENVRAVARWKADNPTAAATVVPKGLSEQGLDRRAISPPMNIREALGQAGKGPDQRGMAMLLDRYGKETDPGKKAQILKSIRQGNQAVKVPSYLDSAKTSLLSLMGY